MTYSGITMSGSLQLGLAFQKKNKSKTSKANNTLHSTPLQKNELKITRLNQKGELDFAFSQ
jgi:hypothetical protein